MVVIGIAQAVVRCERTAHACAETPCVVSVSTPHGVSDVPRDRTRYNDDRPVDAGAAERTDGGER